MRTRRLIRIAAALAAALLLILGLGIGFRTAAAPKAVIWAGSDLQGEGRDGAVLAELLEAVRRDGHRRIDEALFLGDYSSAYDTGRSEEGIGIVRDCLYSGLGLHAEDILLLQGNHDPAETAGLSPSGAHERQHYSVFIINEGDFPAFADADSAHLIRQTADALDSYLALRAERMDPRPVFVLTHIPLHMSWREDNRYAQYLVDVLNRGAERGLDIIVLFGHNHSDDYDSYLGGSCICLLPGDSMPIPDPTAEFGSMAYQSAVLDFVYLNAGYVGFTATGEPGEARSCTVFEVYDDHVSIARYDAFGPHPLKNIGRESLLDGGWAPDLTSLPAKMTVFLQEKDNDR